MVKKILVIVVIIAAISGVAVYKYSNKTHTDVTNLQADFTVQATDIIKAFSDDEVAAGQLYVDKLVEVSGPFVSLETSSGGQVVIYLIDDFDSGISAAIDSAFYQNNKQLIDGLSADQNIKLKGMCSGSLMGTVQLSRSILVKD